MAYKVKKEVDRFNNRFTMTMNKGFKLSRDLFGDLSTGHGAKLELRYVSQEGNEAIIIDYYYKQQGGGASCPYLKDGKMIIRLDDRENLSFNFIGDDDRDVSTYNDNNGGTHYIHHEYNYVIISDEELEKICKASIIEIKIEGRYSLIYSAKKCRDFNEYCEVFYNALHNKSISTKRDGRFDVIDEQRQSTKTNFSTIIILLLILVVICLGVAIYLGSKHQPHVYESEISSSSSCSNSHVDTSARVKAEQAAEEARRQRELEEESQVVPSIEALLKFLKKPGQNHIFEDISGLYVSYLTKYDEYHESEGYGDDGSVHHTIYGHNVSIDQTNPIRLSADDERAFYIDVVHSYYELSAKFFFKRKSDYKKFVKRIKSSDKFKRKGEFIDGFYECFNEFIVDFGQKSTITKGWHGVVFSNPLEE